MDNYQVPRIPDTVKKADDIGYIMAAWDNDRNLSAAFSEDIIRKVESKVILPE